MIKNWFCKSDKTSSAERFTPEPLFEPPEVVPNPTEVNGSPISVSCTASVRNKVGSIVASSEVAAGRATPFCVRFTKAYHRGQKHAICS